MKTQRNSIPIISVIRLKIGQIVLLMYVKLLELYAFFEKSYMEPYPG